MKRRDLAAIATAAIALSCPCLRASSINQQGPDQNNLDIIYYIPNGQGLPTETVLDVVDSKGTEVSFYYGVSGYNQAITQVVDLVNSGEVNPLNMRAQYIAIDPQVTKAVAPEPGMLGFLGLGLVVVWRKLCPSK